MHRDESTYERNKAVRVPRPRKKNTQPFKALGLQNSATNNIVNYSEVEGAGISPRNSNELFSARNDMSHGEITDD